MPRRRTRWLAAAALLAAAAALVAALLTPPPAVPLHFWVRTDEGPGRFFESPGGPEVRGPDVAVAAWNCDSLVITHRTPRVREMLADLGIGEVDLRQEYARPLRPARDDGWCEFLVVRGSWPADAVPDPDLAGRWSMAHVREPGDGVTTVLCADGTLTGFEGRNGCAKWARVGDVIVFGTTSSSWEEILVDAVLLDPAAQTLRYTSGLMLKRVR